MKRTFKFVMLITLFISLSYGVYYYSVLASDIQRNYDMKPFYYLVLIAKPIFYYSFGYLLFDTLVAKLKFHLNKNITNVLSVLIFISYILYAYLLINKIGLNSVIFSDSAILLCYGIVTNIIINSNANRMND